MCPELLLLCVSLEIWAYSHVGSVPRKACVCRSYVVGFQRVQTKLVEANLTLKVSHSFLKLLESLHMLLLLYGNKVYDHRISLYEPRLIILQQWWAQCGSRYNFRNMKQKGMKLDEWLFHPHSYKNIILLRLAFSTIQQNFTPKYKYKLHLTQKKLSRYLASLLIGLWTGNVSTWRHSVRLEVLVS